MNAFTLSLPIRLVPRKGQQIGMLLFFMVFFSFALVWMAGAAGVLDLDDGTLRLPPPGGWAGAAFALFGLPFAAVGLGGMAVAILKMRRNSPYYHIAIDSSGLTVKELFKFRRFDWDKLPGFETIKVERRTKNGRSISHYTVATELLPDNSQREILRIRADDYGAKSGQEDAEALAAWFNQLRDLALDHRLHAQTDVPVPEPFRATAIAVSARPAQPSPTGGVTRQASAAARRPTVDRQ